MKTHKNALLKQSPIIRLWVKSKVGKPDFGSKVIEGHAECKEIPKFENLTMAETCIARPKSENQTIDKSQSPKTQSWIIAPCENRTVLIIPILLIILII